MARLRDDTIVAIATTIGRGALAMVRVSGSEAHRIVRPLLRPWPAMARQATLCDLVDPDSGARVDQVMVVVYDAPRSYTGEPMVELTGHGGPLSPVAVATLLVRAGARQAEPGEFTQRAVLQGKMDLLQAEALADVVDARTDALRRAALFQLDGSLSRRIRALREAVLDLDALIAYDVDFPEEDDGPIPPERIERACTALLAEISTLLKTAPIGEVLRDGAVVSIAGPPNVGKSSLFNALLGQERALVSATPGTTRDAIDATIDADGWPVRLLDTAGLREEGDAIELQGIELSRRYIERSDVVLVCDDMPERVERSVGVVRALTQCALVAVRTKRDLQPTPAPALGHVAGAQHSVSVSAVTREGLEELRGALSESLSAKLGSPHGEAPVLTRVRHRTALTNASRELQAFLSLWRTGEVPAAIASVHIHAASSSLEELIGAVDVEHVLERVFSTFCVGK